MESMITQNEKLKILMIRGRLVTSNEFSGAQIAVLTHTVGKVSLRGARPDGLRGPPPGLANSVRQF